MALFKPWRYLVPKLPNLDVAKEARILCDACSLPKRNLVFPTQNSISENEQVVTIHNTLLIIQKIQMHMYLPISRAKQTLLLFEKMKTQQFISVIFSYEDLGSTFSSKPISS